MSFVKLSFKNRDAETYEVAGSVKVEVPTATHGLLSLSFHPESLLAVEFMDVASLEPDVGVYEGAGDIVYDDQGGTVIATVAEPEPAPKKPSAKKPAAKAKTAVKKAVAKAKPRKPAPKKK